LDADDSVPSLGVRFFTMTKNIGHQYLRAWTVEVIIPPDYRRRDWLTTSPGSQVEIGVT